jgi:hypothetical protein
MPKRKTNQSRAETLKSFGVTTLLKLVALQADASHNGEFTIIAAGSEFKAIYGQGAPSAVSDIPAHDSLKSALVALLVESPTFADESALAASRRL